MKLFARYINALLGVWLVISAFVWPHSLSQQTNTWIVGVLAAAFALIAMAREQARYLNSALAIWLFASIWILPDVARATQWNNALIAIAIFIFSLVPNAPRMVRRPVARAGTPATAAPGRI